MKKINPRTAEQEWYRLNANRRLLLSLLVATLASYTTLDLARHINHLGSNRYRQYWLLGGAFAMGIGIWSMHFIGMLAFHLPIPISYDVPISLLSLVIAVLASGFALYLVSRATLTLRRLAGGGVLITGSVVTAGAARTLFGRDPE